MQAPLPPLWSVRSSMRPTAIGASCGAFNYKRCAAKALYQQLLAGMGKAFLGAQNMQQFSNAILEDQ